MDRFSLFIHAVTPLHVGVGRAEGAHVDLPVQRDEFGLPTIWASSLKGALKSHAMRRNKDLAIKVFGREPGEIGPDIISGVTLLDARLLAIPARSLKGIWTYVTSPHMLGNFVTYVEFLGVRGLDDLKKRARELLDATSGLRSGEAVISSGELLGKDGRLYLNEIPYDKPREEPRARDFIDGLAKLVTNMPKRSLVVINDDDVVDIVNKSMLIQYRVRLTEHKTVARGALWSEEYVPQFSSFFSGVICRQVKEGESTMSAKEVCEKFVELLEHAKGSRRAYVWVGGKETIGRGLVELYVV